ncbi:MAG: cell division protein FtsQ/DivIB [Cyanophyceae cyanobacterium]
MTRRTAARRTALKQKALKQKATKQKAIKQKAIKQNPGKQRSRQGSAPIHPVSRESLVQRRSQLKRQRSVQFVWGGWQSLGAIALLVSAGWLISAPVWVVRSPEQIAIEGNTRLNDAEIRQLLGLTYPQSLWRLDPDDIADSLKARAPIDEVTVTRQLLPPGLTVQIQELQPVAVAQLIAPVSGSNRPDSSQSTSAVGLIDKDGKWIEISRFQQGKNGRSLPPLKVTASGDRLAQQWPALYRQINLAPVRISAVQWQNAENLILKTELGTVYLGPFGANFNDQLNQLANLKNLVDQINPDTLSHIDLRDLNAPLIQTKGARPADKRDKGRSLTRQVN